MSFFRPFKYIKRFLPKTLFARSILIILAPLILVQVVTTYVFIDRHWDWVTKLLANNLAGQVATLSDLVEKDPQLALMTKLRFALDTQFEAEKSLVLEEKKKDLNWDERFFNKALVVHLRRLYRLNIKDDRINVDIAVKGGILHVKIARKRLFSKTTPIFLMWSIFTPLLFFVIAALFMRNQIKPIRRLANVAHRFGRGQPIQDFKPEGAFEVRRVGAAFNIMRERLQRQIRQRTEMLAGVSHDLRTPLTRIELQLALMKSSADTKAIKADLKEMSHIIDEYLAFSRGEEQEKVRQTDITSLIDDVIKKSSAEGAPPIHFLAKASLSFPVRPMTLRRCITNLIDNAKKFADKIWVDLEEDEQGIHIYVDDDGPGIPEQYRKEALQPFSRLEGSRNPETGGSGLGLAIAHSIVLNHGGSITLEDSEHGGLRAHVFLPKV